MRFNLFASSLIFALSSAILMEAADLVGDLDDNELIAAQIGASVEWTSDGRHKSEYKRPQDHCCWLYVDGTPKYGGFKTAAHKEYCWKKEGSVGQSYTFLKKSITGIDCGKNAWIEVIENDVKHQSVAGRIVFDLMYFSTEKFYTFNIGPYDDKIMPAAILYGSAAKTHQCVG